MYLPIVCVCVCISIFSYLLRDTLSNIKITKISHHGFILFCSYYEIEQVHSSSNSS